MFKHRLNEFCRALLLAVCLLFVGGSLQSCRDWLDDYKYDDTEPDWLGASIYSFLKEGTANCTYNYYVELIDSLGEMETLNHTGSKTLFVADDKAFERFFAPGGNPWGVSCIPEMSKAQMKILLYGSMLNNTLLLDMMANTGANPEQEGLCLRRTTSLHELDTVPLVHANSYENHAAWPTYNVYWDNLRGKERTDSSRIAMDGTTPMMVHFLGDYLKRNALTVDDVNFLFQKKDGNSKLYEDGSVMIYGNKVLKSDVSYGEFSDDTLTIACKNGYIYRLDDVLLPPTNMAGEIRAHKDLKIFSHLLDRFCVPVYDANLTASYRERHASTDSVFKLRYFNEADFTSYDMLEGISVLSGELLLFDPGKNDYASNLGRQSDMAAMFVPKDDKLYEYFAALDGPGHFLLERYAPEIDVPETWSEENEGTLLQALDSVPQQNIAPFLNNLMKPSFVNTVKSKFDKITNDANDDMKLREEHVDECIVANNGVVYLLNEVFAPAAYSAVTAPTLVNENMTIMKNVIDQLSYDFYLLAMDAKYTLILPDDSKFRYFDPVTFEGNSPKMYEFRYDNEREKNSGTEVEFWSIKYDVNAGNLNLKLDTLGNISKVESTNYSLPVNGNFGGNALLVNRMTDLLEYLIIVHNNREEKPYVHADKQYYLTKGFGTIKIDAENPDEIKFYGGEQLETNTTIVASKSIKQDNGITYSTTPVEQDEEMRLYSSVPTPPRRNVYQNMKANGEAPGSLYNEFYKMCTMSGFDEIGLDDIYIKVLPGDENKKQRQDSTRIYSIFYTTPEPADGQKLTTKIINSVPFLNTYHYTVYIPSNEAITELYAEGFPTWEDVENEYNNKNYGRAASMIRFINNFIRNHFQDNSVFCDKSPFEYLSVSGQWVPKASFPTSVIDPATGRFYENEVTSASDNSTILVKDPYNVAKEKKGETAEWAKVVKSGDENVTWNVMCRDIVYSLNTTAEPDGISTSSFSALQPIDRVLKTPSMYGYDGNLVRFIKTGEKVDTMSVNDGQGGLAGLNDNCYLVAKCGKVNITLPDNTIEKVDPSKANIKNKVHEIAYLLKPKSTDVTNVEKEELLDASNPKIITREGYLVKFVKATDDVEEHYEYETAKNEAGKECKQMVDNSGNVIKKVEIVTADTNVEE